ncbi:glutamate synthase-related protein [Alicyclobacillus tolerans]|uniref:Glutamate synthase (NADPH/NADH) large chain n=1 Tax=Alicyclobacillus tolerans TaxID=90970 RepID=A0ABT9LVL2_9BACL|nr:glutamate synthase-related protein [Alicyclobacillus tengchongensis]MDP9728317.1 glutamate synthase (NADPH/NADH) large chain [Alicyclobacillus tengchongensis]
MEKNKEWMGQLTQNIDREHDACGLFARIEKDGKQRRETVLAGIRALAAMRHRAGYVRQEGDGCGLQLDIPRALWQKKLALAGQNAEAVWENGFFVGHFYLQRAQRSKALEKIHLAFKEADINILLESHQEVDETALGESASRENPIFLQIAGYSEEHSLREKLFTLALQLEEDRQIHVVSLDTDTVVYKVVGDEQTLYRYHKDLQDHSIGSSVVLAHTRYSTNTATAFARVQPFATLGHNGEINTISRFYSEAKMAGFSLSADASDSQMVDRFMHGLMAMRNWSLMESMELIFPPILFEIKRMPKTLINLYMFYRALWGPFAQGPAGVISRYGDELVASVDALGLRPMWLMETEDAWTLGSEQGLVPAQEWVSSPKPLSPGEKIAFLLKERKLLTYKEVQETVYSRASLRFDFHTSAKTLRFSGLFVREHHASHPQRDTQAFAVRAAALGFREEDLKLLEAHIHTGAEPIRSLGYDSPLAPFADGLKLVSDYLQESVAVVTNPAIDREREIEHFSTRAVLGRRPSFTEREDHAMRIEIQAPLLLEEQPDDVDLDSASLQSLAHRLGTMLYEDALDSLHTRPEATAELMLVRQSDESLENFLQRLGQDAKRAVEQGAVCLVLDDRLQFRRGEFVDPLLALSAVQRVLWENHADDGEMLRRHTSILLRSGALRNLHDVVCALGLGADAVVPYMMWEYAARKGSLPALENLYKALCKGLEKVLSTLGIHELRGYERLFGGIGLSEEIAQWLGVPNFCGGKSIGLTFDVLEEDSQKRRQLYQVASEKLLPRQKNFQLYPRIWKSAGQVAEGQTSYQQFFSKLDAFEKENPLSLRHVMDFRTTETKIDKKDVDTAIDIHDYPILISSMSFGSQSEVAYRAYIEAAKRLNIVCVNGEGGEIKDLLHRYPHHRGRQIASGRFGVNAELCNDAYMLEIKIGQGAKPGEGGHLPGSKVTEQVAKARNATMGTDLISPSNNHDIYSIEDLAQVIFELKQVNPHAKVGVKVPVVPNIGTIAVGIVKAGADIVTLSGFDGGTGAARAHAIRHVGLPMEIGIKAAHDALVAAGLREVAEIWADGGIKSGADVMKAVLLGANRVGFGTMAMVAIGCTSCRACHKDTCHVGIATQMQDMEEAREKGLTTFQPRDFEQAVDQLVRFFGAIGEHVAELTAALGATRTQDLVGRRDLLKQISHQQTVHLADWLKVDEKTRGVGSQIIYRESVSLAEENLLAVEATGTDSVTAHSSYNGTEITAPSSDNVRVPRLVRALGTEQSGQAVRSRIAANEHVEWHEVAGSGFAAYSTAGMVHTAWGGSQDGVGKGAFGGRVLILKQRAKNGRWLGGSVGKSLAYGAQSGLFIIQGNADARAGIRLSGADVIIAGEPEGPVDNGAFLAANANIKGFAFEYMTNGRALVLGDPGSWICAGMTGGTVYLRWNPSWGLTEQTLRMRLAKGAKVSLRYLDADGNHDVRELLGQYMKVLRLSGQWEEAAKIQKLANQPSDHFMMVKPGQDITDQDIATE